MDKLVRANYSEVRHKSAEGLMMGDAKARYDADPDENIHLMTKRIALRDNDKDLIYLGSGAPFRTKMLESAVRLPLTSYSYARFFPLARRAIMELGDGQKYQFSFTDRQGHSHPMTKILIGWGNFIGIPTGFYWEHTAIENLKSGWPHLEEVSRELATMEVPSGDIDALATFTKELARLHWLGAHLILTNQGNPRNVLNLLARHCLDKGLTCPVPTKKAAQLECIALTMPLEEYVDKFTTFLDVKPSWRTKD